jgi:hypothetical protein
MKLANSVASGAIGWPCSLSGILIFGNHCIYVSLFSYRSATFLTINKLGSNLCTLNQNFVQFESINKPL